MLNAENVGMLINRRKLSFSAGTALLDGVTLALNGLGLKTMAQATVERNSVDVAKAAGKDAQANVSSMEGYVAAKLFVEGLKRASGKLSRDSR